MHFAQAPEALLGRSDSKNPMTTCKGITTSGRPCRRALAGKRPVTAKGRVPPSLRSDGYIMGTVAEGLLEESELYCWQHKEQAVGSTQTQPAGVQHSQRRPSQELLPLQERSSIETMMQRLDINPPVTEGNAAACRSDTQGQLRSSEKPLRSDREEQNRQSQRPEQHKESGTDVRKRPRPPQRKVGFWQSLCCLAGDDDDYIEVVRHRKRVDPNRPPHNRVSTAHVTNYASGRHAESASIDKPTRPAFQAEPRLSGAVSAQQWSSPIDQLLGLIPRHTPPQTASALLAELAKPISPHDEDGYIYIFWLTSQDKQVPDGAVARSLLSPPASRPQHTRRISDVMTEYSFDGSVPETKGRDVVMLKIGRANNVTRRMQEWQRQCGYELNLVRYYPYSPSSGAPSPQSSPHRPSTSRSAQSPANAMRRESGIVRKVPFVKRVERLIHLELADKQVKRQCTTCGREHREWFEIPASQAGVRAVDECIRRWTNWAETTSLLDPSHEYV